jgi:hypothetical protein
MSGIDTGLPRDDDSGMIDKTFVFWLLALYTLALFAVQVFEMATGRATQDFKTVNAVYLAFLSTYVGGKEVARWRGKREAVLEDEGPRLSGSWFVGLWAIFLLGATIANQFWPDQVHYPHGLNTITLEVVSFYVGSSVSRWLKGRQEGPENLPASQSVETERPAAALTAHQERQGRIVAAEARRKGSLTRPDVESLTQLERSAALALLTKLVEAGWLRRTGTAGSTETLYEATGRDLPPGPAPK